jgi:hypothetical protein
MQVSVPNRLFLKNVPQALPFILFALAMLALAGCTGPDVVALGAGGALIYATKPEPPPPADTADQIAQHESWCYETLGDAACYAHPQDTDPNRLINVDPENRYPLTTHNYNVAVAQDKAAQDKAAASDNPAPQ